MAYSASIMVTPGHLPTAAGAHTYRAAKGLMWVEDNPTPSAASLVLDVKSATVAQGQTGSQLSIELTADGAAKFRDFTQAAMGRQTQVLIDGKVVIEPWIREPIMGGRITISDGANVSALENMAKQLAAPDAKIRVQLSPQ